MKTKAVREDDSVSVEKGYRKFATDCFCRTAEGSSTRSEFGIKLSDLGEEKGQFISRGTGKLWDVMRNTSWMLFH